MRAFFALLLILGIGLVGYQIGLSQAVTVAPGTTGVPVAPYYYWHPFGFFGFLFPILGIFLIFALFRALTWGRGWGGHHGMGYGSWREGGPRSMLEEWHREAHGDKPRGGERPQGGESEAGPGR
jgi:hypothetical protein